MPALALDQQRCRQTLAVGSVQPLDARDRLVEHLALDGAPLGVEFVESHRQGAYLMRIVAREQARAEIGLSHPTAGIDSRP